MITLDNRLAKAAEFLQQGWTRFYYWTTQPLEQLPSDQQLRFFTNMQDANCHCLIGAVKRAYGNPRTTYFLLPELSTLRLLQKQLPPEFNYEDESPVRQLLRFNDMQTSAEPALQLIEKARACLKSG